MDVDTVVVTRHPALVSYLCASGIIPSRDGWTPDCQVIEHAKPEDVRGMHVIGVLPLHLAAEAVCVTEIPMDIPPECRGRELTYDETRQFAGKPVTYQVYKREGSNRD